MRQFRQLTRRLPVPSRRGDGHLATPAPTGNRRGTGRSLGRKSILPALLVALALVATACGTAGTRLQSQSGISKKSSASAPPFTYAAAVIWGTSWSYNDLNPNFAGLLNDYAQLPLAFVEPPKFGDYEPEIASSWTTTPTTVTVHLRRSAKWQNGQPVTSKDLVDTLLLQGTNGNAVWNEISGLSAPNAHTVVLKLQPHTPPALLLQNLLPIYTLPSSVYGRFVIPGLQSDLLKYFAESKTNAAAATSPAGKAVSGVFTKLSAYSPKQFIGDGPFKLVSITTSEAKMSKWSGFWAAKSIHAPGMDFLNDSTNSGNYEVLLSGRTDFLSSGISYQIVQRWKGQPDAGYTTTNNYRDVDEYFNNQQYPLNLVGVRKALAYLINRPKTAVAANGGNPPYKLQLNAVSVPDGLPPVVQNLYLTKKQVHSLNPYNYSPKKATSILKGLGFKKTAGKWITPQGKPFTLSIGAPTCCALIETMETYVAHVLTSFGIPSTVDELDTATFDSYQHEGKFSIDFGWDTNGFLDPLEAMTSVLGPGNNFSSSGAYKGQKGIGYGPTAVVPGLGKVNVPTTLVQEEASIPQGKQWAALTWDWARLVNRQLPFLTLSYKLIQSAYSTARYGDWPPRSSSLWRLMGMTPSSALVSMMEKGYLRPKS